MHRVRTTKNPSFRQIENMRANLKDLYGKYANIQTKTYTDTTYWISNGDDFFRWVDTWQELQLEYHKIIKEWREI